MDIINLENLDGIPQEYLNELSNYDSLFKTCQFIEDLEDEIEISKLISKVNTYCSNNIIIGFHYTRAFPNEISEYGLISRTGKEIRENFLKKYADLFTTQEIKKIITQWENYFSEGQMKSRDNRIFFNFTKEALNNFGAKPLLSNFGGEQIYMPLHSINCIGEKIRTLGIPLILKCKLLPENIKTFEEEPWGKIAISSYHRIQNKNAFQTDQDGYQIENVLPQNIEITEYQMQ